MKYLHLTQTGWIKHREFFSGCEVHELTRFCSYDRNRMEPSKTYLITIPTETELMMKLMGSHLTNNVRDFCHSPDLNEWKFKLI